MLISKNYMMGLAPMLFWRNQTTTTSVVFNFSFCYVSQLRISLHRSICFFFRQNIQRSELQEVKNLKYYIKYEKFNAEKGVIYGFERINCNDCFTFRVIKWR